MYRWGDRGTKGSNHALGVHPPVKAKAPGSTMVLTFGLPGFVLEGPWYPKRVMPEPHSMGPDGRHGGDGLQHLVPPGLGPMSRLSLEEQEAAPSGLPAKICLSPW